MVLVLADAAKMIWGTQQLSVSRPPSLAGAMTLFGAVIPHYNLFIMMLGPALALYDMAGAAPHPYRTDGARRGARPRNAGRARRQRRPHLHQRPSRPDRFSQGLAGALVTPIKTVVPGMDVEIIVEAFIVIVIGGLGSLWGTFIGALIYGQFLSFGILIFPRFSIFSVYALMAIILIIRPWGLFGKPLPR